MEEKVTIEKTGWWKSFLKSEFFYHYKHNIPAIIGSILVVVAILVAVFGRFLAPQNPYDLTAISLADSYLPPVWLDGGKAGFFLGSIFSQLDPGVFYHNTIAIYIISIIDPQDGRVGDIPVNNRIGKIGLFLGHTCAGIQDGA